MRDQPAPRRCDKPSCGESAAASLSFRYDTGEVWLSDLAEQAHPSRYDLCQRHAEELTVPRGWQRVDERTASVHAIAPPADAGQARDRVAVGEGTAGPGTAGGDRSHRANRYAELSADLPRLAAEAGVGPSEATGPAGGEAEHGAPHGREGGPLGPPATSRGLTPADVPGGGGVVVDFFDRSRERQARDDEAATPDADQAGAPDADEAGDRVDRPGSPGADDDGDHPDPQGPSDAG
jgi:hypothetical protein